MSALPDQQRQQRHHPYDAPDVLPGDEYSIPEMMSTEPRPRMNGAVMFIIAALGITMVGLLYLIQTNHVAGLGYDVSRLERERMAASLENQSLTYEISRFQALPYIERIAVVDMGMQPVAGQVYLTVPFPASPELVVPEPEVPASRSLGERLWDALMGQAEASNSSGAGQ